MYENVRIKYDYNTPDSNTSRDEIIEYSSLQMAMANLTAIAQSLSRRRRDEETVVDGESNDGILQGLDGPTLTMFYELLRSLHNSSAGNGSSFQLKPIFLHNYVFFIFIYGLLGVSAIYLNVYFIWRSMRLKLYKSSLHYFLIHIAFTHTLAAAFMLPTSLAILLSRYWVFGDFMCYTLTMVQDLPSRTVLLLFVLIAIDRYRQFAYNSLDALPRHGCVIVAWTISICLSFPACVFVVFHDIHAYFKLDILKGIGLCVVNNHSMEEYARAMFVVVYVVPLAVFAFAFTRISVELPRQEQPVLLAHLSNPTSGGSGLEDWGIFGMGTLDSENVNADVERRIQRYLTACGILVAISSLPLNIMSVIQFGLTEDYGEKTATYDVTYAFFVWISFLPTVGTPVLCLAMMSVAGCPLLYRLMKRWRDGDVTGYVRRFSDFGSASNASRLYPRMGTRSMINRERSTTISIRNRSRSMGSSKSTAISAVTAVSSISANFSNEKDHAHEETQALMIPKEHDSVKKTGRRLSVSVLADTERTGYRKITLNTSISSPIVN